MTFKGWFYTDYHYARFIVLAAWCLPVTLGFILHGDIYQWLLVGTLAIGVNLVQWLDILVPRFVRWRRRSRQRDIAYPPWWLFLDPNAKLWWERPVIEWTNVAPSVIRDAEKKAVEIGNQWLSDHPKFVAKHPELKREAIQ